MANIGKDAAEPPATQRRPARRLWGKALEEQHRTGGHERPHRRPPLPVAWWLGLLAVTGCASAMQPMGPARMAPALIDGFAIAADGYFLPLRVWRPQGIARGEAEQAAPETAVVIALHGFNDYSNAFSTVGPVFAAAGIVTYAYDQRGFGATQRRGVWPGGATLAADLATVVGLLRERHPGLPVYLLGESMGGAVVMSALAAAQSAPASPLAGVAGVILVAPAVWGRETMGPVPRAALWLTNALVPGFAMTAPRELKIRPSDNVEMLKGLSRDPLVIKATRADTIHGLVGLMGEALAVAPRFQVPGLVLYGVHEQVLPYGAISRLLTTLPQGRQRVGIYRDGWHMLLRDRHAGVVIADILSWLRNPVAMLPSGADQVSRARIFER